jgi:hypothetical protein
VSRRSPLGAAGLTARLPPHAPTRDCQTVLVEGQEVLASPRLAVLLASTTIGSANTVTVTVTGTGTGARAGTAMTPGAGTRAAVLSAFLASSSSQAVAVAVAKTWHYLALAAALLTTSEPKYWPVPCPPPFAACRAGASSAEYISLSSELCQATSQPTRPCLPTFLPVSRAQVLSLALAMLLP